MTLFECYDARKGTLRARLAETTTLAQATAALAETLDAVHYDFANDCKDDALRAEAVYMISAVKTTFPLLECASRTKIWESRVSGESGKKRAPKWPAAICLLLGLCLAAGTVMLFYSQNPEFKFGDWQAWLGALGCALILMLIAGMLFMRQPKIVIGDVERTVAVAIDP
ncbi:MAG: hypothetical protein RRY38_03465, partial [Oscillospiraceae bacterium]